MEKQNVLISVLFYLKDDFESEIKMILIIDDNYLLYSKNGVLNVKSCNIIKQNNIKRNLRFIIMVLQNESIELNDYEKKIIRLETELDIEKNKTNKLINILYSIQEGDKEINLLLNKVEENNQQMNIISQYEKEKKELINTIQFLKEQFNIVKKKNLFLEKSIIKVEETRLKINNYLMKGI